MKKPHFERKVGLFVLVGLVLLAGLLIQFSKGLTFFRPTYEIYVRTPNVGELKVNAGVLMSGVQVGTVVKMELARDGRSVTLTLRIFEDYVVHRDARFVIEQSNFLGDQYVAITPTENKSPPFKNHETAEAEAPLSLQEVTRSASGFITRVDATVKKFNDSLEEVTRVLLNPQNLTNLSVTAANMRTVSERAVVAIDEISSTVATNSPSLATSLSNLVEFSDQMNQFASGFRSLLDTNSDDVSRAVKNIESSSESLKAVMNDLQAGKGFAGNMLKDEQMASKMSQIVDNLSVTTSNLNRLGLWGILWRQKPSRTNVPSASAPLTSPKATE